MKGIKETNAYNRGYDRGLCVGHANSRETIAKIQAALTKALEENLRLRDGASAHSGISALADAPENSKNSAAG